MKLVIIGASGHASDILGALEAASSAQDSVGVLLDAEFLNDMARFGFGRNVEYLGNIEFLKELEARYVIAVGYPRSRYEIFERIRTFGKLAESIIHPSAHLGTGTTIGEGTVILSGACISPLVSIGEHVYISQLASIGHHTRIGSFASVMPGACVSGDVSIGTGALIGTNATILEKVEIGDRAVVGAGAVVREDVLANTTVAGVPARVIAQTI